MGGDRIAFLFIELPADEPGPLWRLRDVHVAMRERKRGGEPGGAEALLRALSWAAPAARGSSARAREPRALQPDDLEHPRPSGADDLMGCPVTSAYPVVPLTERHRLSIDMTTVHGRACFGVYADAALAGDADRLLHAVDREIDDLLELAVAASSGGPRAALTAKGYG